MCGGHRPSLLYQAAFPYNTSRSVVFHKPQDFTISLATCNSHFSILVNVKEIKYDLFVSR